MLHFETTFGVPCDFSEHMFRADPELRQKSALRYVTFQNMPLAMFTPLVTASHSGDCVGA
jgi:hypothetical protein